MRILNLTQHPATPEQIAAGVIDVDSGKDAEELRALLTFDTLPSQAEIQERAKALALWASDYPIGPESNPWEYPTHALIGGAPFLMSALEAALLERGIVPLYAFSVRDSAEQVQADGSVRKINVFKHVGFVNVALTQ